GRQEVSAPGLALALALGVGDGADDGIHRQVAEAVDGARDWLVAHQNKDGSFGSFKTERWFEVSATVPSAHEAFRFATSALGVMALDQCARPNEAAAAGASRGIDWMVAHDKVKRYDGSEFYNTCAL